MQRVAYMRIASAGVLTLLLGFGPAALLPHPVLAQAQSDSDPAQGPQGLEKLWQVIEDHPAESRSDTKLAFEQAVRGAFNRHRLYQTEQHNSIQACAAEIVADHLLAGAQDTVVVKALTTEAMQRCLGEFGKF